ncbi:hypothetical protein Poly41_26680 [Novipirellula artificiosorum]|uniref:Twin-arginine translocation signal domain-containing protein n=1 Tax=Novipirellula artificiosorum TaxID=2528016 RepID=A0A5C6DT07_9BACT|nr:hypothetical protein Poly41_26680 [Novipirellula artificiosorum]
MPKTNRRDFLNNVAIVSACTLSGMSYGGQTKSGSPTELVGASR